MLEVSLAASPVCHFPYGPQATMSIDSFSNLAALPTCAAEDATSAEAEDQSARLPVQSRAAVRVEARVADEAQLQALIARVTRQDEAALAQLYEATAGRVHGLALRIVRNAELAEEVTEDTFWQIWRQAPRFDRARGTAIAWIMTMARSRALDALRARDPAIANEDTAALLDAKGETDPSPEELLSAVQSEHRLHAALAQLDPQPRQLIALAFFRGLTHDEIASHTGIPLGTVKSHIRRGMNTLKAALGEQAGTDREAS